MFSLYTLKIINAQENVGSKQFIYKGDTIAIQAISLYEIPDELEHDKTSIQNLRSALEPDFQISLIDSAAKSANNRIFSEKENLFKNKGDLTARTIRDKTSEWVQYRLKINENLSYVNDKLAKIEKQQSERFIEK